jgi:hypothetical protein
MDNVQKHNAYVCDVVLIYLPLYSVHNNSHCDRCDRDELNLEI